MKRVFCLFLTLLMILGCSLSAFAAEKAANKPVYSLATKNRSLIAFMEDENGYIDLDKPLKNKNYNGSSGYQSNVYFGKYVYIALVNDLYNEDVWEDYRNYNEKVEKINSLKKSAENIGINISADTEDAFTYERENLLLDRENVIKYYDKLSNCVSYSSASDINGFNAATDSPEINSILDKYSKGHMVDTISNNIDVIRNDLFNIGQQLYSKIEDLKNKIEALHEYNDAINKIGTNPNDIDHYMFINEEIAIKNAKVTTSGFSSQAKKFIDTTPIYVDENGNEKGFGIVRKHAKSDFLWGFTSTTRSTVNKSTSNYIYVLQIPINEYDKLNSTIDMLDGHIRIRKSTGTTNEFDLDFDFYFFPDQVIAEGTGDKKNSYTAEITKDAKWFTSDFWQEGDEEYEFTFKEDKNSYFIVNMERQIKPIQLAFDIEYPEDEYDYLMEHNGYPDVQFYNGYQTGANFTKKGTLYLYWWGDGKAYVYKINDDAAKTLTYMPDVKKDTDYYYGEDCYAITTNRLDRYLISDRPLTCLQLAETPGPTQEELDAQAAAEAEAARIKAEQEEAARKAAEEEAARKAAEEAARKAAEEEAARLAEEAKKSAEEQQVKPITPAIEKDEGMPIIAWVAIVGGIILVVIAVGVMFYTRGNSKKNSSESSNSNKNNSNKRRML